MWFPVEHLSYSSIKSYCSNRHAFYQRYVNHNLKKNIYSAASLIGTAGHKGLEVYVRSGGNLPLAFQEIEEVVDRAPDEELDLGVTGTREKCQESAKRGVQFYLAEHPFVLDSVIGAELLLEKECSYNGIIIPVTLKCYTDLILKSEKEDNVFIDLVDYKFKGKFSDPTILDPAYVIQAMTNFLVVEAEFGYKPRKFTFREIKVSQNKDGGPQTQDIVFYYEDCEQYMKAFLWILKYVLDEINMHSPKISPIPNFWDQYSGLSSFEDFLDELVCEEFPDFSEYYYEKI